MNKVFIIIIIIIIIIISSFRILDFWIPVLHSVFRIISVLVLPIVDTDHKIV